MWTFLKMNIQLWLNKMKQIGPCSLCKLQPTLGKFYD